MMPKRLVVCLCAALLPAAATAQQYPAKPIRLLTAEIGVGMELIGGTPAHFDQFIKTDTARMSKVIKAAGIRAE